jgi:RNA polymerase sigma-70 factor (ECF subfamily)
VEIDELETGVTDLLDHLFRRQSALMVATLTRAIGARHLALAEEAVQDALVTALQQWPYRGLPDDPAAWLFRVARNRVLDRLRHNQIADRKTPDVAEAFGSRATPQAPDALLTSELPPLDDDQLAMMFLTCHPALPQDSRVALTLKIVGGFSVAEIARAFLAHESAIAQRLVRAKRLLRERDVGFGQPNAADLAERLESVLEAVYLAFNEGYAATAGDAMLREDIAAEAIRLARLLTHHPATAVPKAWALLALLLLHAARFRGRVNSQGELFLLRDQDRSAWDQSLISEGMRALDRAAQGEDVSRYHLEAEIAGCHVSAATWKDTDWKRILECYEQLAELTGSPVVMLNRAIARAQVEGPHAALAELDAIASHPALAKYHLLPAVQAEIWREAGDARRAAEYYREALALAASAPERRFLSTRLGALGG